MVGFTPDEQVASRRRVRAAASPSPGPIRPRPATRLERPEARKSVVAGKPSFATQERDGRKSFLLGVAEGEGGLYRIETLGRLHIKLAVGTAFVPEISSGEANGTGQNGLVQSYLHAGVSESARRLGLAAPPATAVERRRGEDLRITATATEADRLTKIEVAAACRKSWRRARPSRCGAAGRPQAP